jgi:DNA-binding CsgD family transcriptional regulator
MTTYVHKLNPRDLRILQYLADGLSINETARTSGEPRQRVCVAIADLKAITGHADRGQAIQEARNQKWIA